MLATVLTKTLRDRWVAMLVGAGLVGLFLVGAMAAYRSVDLAIYTELPEAIRSLMGIQDRADSATLAYGVMLSMVGAMTLGGLAISMGSASVAGEEGAGTIGLLLGNPRSRRQVLVSKLAAMVALVAVGTLVLLGASFLAPALLDVEVGATRVGAMVTHLFANTLLFGLLAAAAGAWTGNRATASATAGGTMVLSYVAVGLLPLVPGAASLAKAVPWFWFEGHDPLANGVSPGWLALQLGAAAVLTGLAWVGVDRRDLRRPSSTASPLDRLREHPQVGAVLDRLSSGGRVGSIWARATSEGQALVIITAVVMFTMMGLLMGPIYVTMADTLGTFSKDLPEAMLALVGGSDLSTPEGWFMAETFSLMAPIATILVAATAGARALAGEEHRRTMALLLANPITRTRIVLEKSLAMAIHTSVVGLATFAGVAGGAWLAGVDISTRDIAATSFLVTLLGLLFGAVALAIGAGTGSARAATLGTVAAASIAWVVNTILGIATSFAGWAVVSPFEWYLGNDPLVNGLAGPDVALLVITTGALIAGSAVLFERRDLRQS